MLPVYPSRVSVISVIPCVRSLSVLEISMLLWPCSSALLILCAMQALLLQLSFRPCRSAIQHCCPTPALQSRANAVHSLHSTSRESVPGPLLPQPPTDHPRGAVSASAHSTDYKHQRVLVTIAFRNDAVATATPFSISFPGGRPPSRAQLSGPRGPRRARAITPPTAPPSREIDSDINQSRAQSLPFPTPAHGCCVIRRVTSGGGRRLAAQASASGQWASRAAQLTPILPNSCLTWTWRGGVKRRWCWGRRAVWRQCRVAAPLSGRGYGHTRLSPMPVTAPRPCGRQMSAQSDVTWCRLPRVPGAAKKRGLVGGSPRCYGVTGTFLL